jgi:hypothetical protein
VNSQSNIEIYVVIKDGIHRYYLLKVERSGFDVYCFPPHLGVHYSMHKSGEVHFKFEDKTNPGKEPPVVLVGEAGKTTDQGILCTPLIEIGSASCICTGLYPINLLSDDFIKFERGVERCFVIDKALFTKDTSLIKIGVWAVPDRNKYSFEFNNPNIPEDLLYKVVQCEPQIWIYAQPC